MNCSSCNAVNDSENVFCVVCGNPVSPWGGSRNSIETEVIETGRPNTSGRNFQPTPGYVPGAKPGNKTLWVVLGALIAVLAAGGIFMLANRNGATDTLPDHLGLFAQNNDRKELSEVAKQDVTNALQARTDLLKNDSLPILDPSPYLILFADSKAVPVNDLRLIQLDTIGDDGSLKQLDFQVAPVEGKPDMKRIRVPAEMANGKYAFALLDGYINDGKHKFWAFQVRNSSKSSNGDALKGSSVGLKPTPPPAPKPVAPPPATAASVAPPAPGNTAVSVTDFLILRAGPGQSYPKLRNLARGESVYIMAYSTNTESFKGRAAPFAQVRTNDGQTGWVFSAFLR